MYSKLDKILYKHKQREADKQQKPLIDYNEWRKIFHFFIKKEQEIFKEKHKPLFKKGDIVTIDIFELANKSRNGWDLGASFLSSVYEKYKLEPFVAIVYCVCVSYTNKEEQWESMYGEYDLNPMESWEKFKEKYKKDSYIFNDFGMYWDVCVKPFNPRMKKFCINEKSFIHLDSEEAKKTFELLKLERKEKELAKQFKQLQTEINEKKQKL